MCRVGIDGFGGLEDQIEGYMEYRKVPKFFLQPLDIIAKLQARLFNPPYSSYTPGHVPAHLIRDGIEWDVG
jgi:hypothetical protein